MTKEDIVRGHIVNQIKQYCIDEGYVIVESTDIDSIFKDANIDSLDMVEIVLDIEDCYGIEIPSDTLHHDMAISEFVEVVYNIISKFIVVVNNIIPE